MAMHSIEFPAHINELAKEKAKARGTTMESLVTGLVEEYGHEDYTPVKPADRGKVTRTRLTVNDEDWDAAKLRAKVTDTNLTSAIIRRIEGLS